VVGDLLVEQAEGVGELLGGKDLQVAVDRTLRRVKRSSSAAATTWPSTTRAAAGSWKTAFTPRTRIP
jgi:hypothetical protein